MIPLRVMKHPPPCPSPSCRGGWTLSPPEHPAQLQRLHTTRCSVCGGAGSIDERAEDLWTAGIVVAGATDEDFRSSPTLWAP